MEQQVNRTCKACRLSKLKCNLASVPQLQSQARCSRCTRLDLDCIVESRGNSGRARLKAEGICALKRGGKESASATAIETMTRTALLSTGAQQILAAPLLQWCGQAAWARDDTRLMAWVLEQAAARGLPLSNFMPAAALPGQLEPTGTGTPPPFIRALLGGGYSDAPGVAFFQCGTRTDWISNDAFDERVCSRRALHDARSRPTCDVSALFTPEEEVEPFERQVVGALFASLAPALESGAETGVADAVGEPAGVQSTLHSEIVDGTSLWRLRQQGTAVQAGDECLVCSVVMRCAVLRGGDEVWMVGSYVPQITVDGSWVTSKEAPRRNQMAADSASCGAAVGELRSVSEPPPRKRRARSCDEDPPLPPTASREPCSPGAAIAELHAESLLQQLQATSTEEVLRMLEQEEGYGEDGLGAGPLGSAATSSAV